MELVTIKTFDNPIEAHILKSKLESESINCALFDENIVGLNPLYSVSVGGIKLKIHQSDVDQALKIIDAAASNSLTTEEGEILQCPKCKSKDIYSGFKSMKGLKGVLSAIVSFLFAVFPIYLKSVYKCKKCGNEFN